MIGVPGPVAEKSTGLAPTTAAMGAAAATTKKAMARTPSLSEARRVGAGSSIGTAWELAAVGGRGPVLFEVMGSAFEGGVTGGRRALRGHCRRVGLARRGRRQARRLSLAGPEDEDVFGAVGRGATTPSQEVAQVHWFVTPA